MLEAIATRVEAVGLSNTNAVRTYRVAAEFLDAVPRVNFREVVHTPANHG